MKEEELKLSADGMLIRLLTRVWAADCARIAIDLAQAVGEEVKRPLSREQLARAFHVNTAEAVICGDLFVQRLSELLKTGSLKEEDL